MHCDAGPSRQGCDRRWVQSVLSGNICTRANEAACYLSAVLIERLDGSPYLLVVQPMTYYSVCDWVRVWGVYVCVRTRNKWVIDSILLAVDLVEQ